MPEAPTEGTLRLPPAAPSQTEATLGCEPPSGVTDAEPRRDDVPTLPPLTPPPFPAVAGARPELPPGGTIRTPDPTSAGAAAGGKDSLTNLLAAGRGAEGRRFGEYLLESELGRGGMGVVFKALHVTLNRPVALKLMLSGEVPDEDRTRFLREAESSASLKHPYIVAVHDVGEEEGKLFFSMDFIEGTTFKNVLQERSRDLTLLLRIFVKICDAVGYAHQKGIIHRDLKPQNVMVDADLNPHVMDFGLARKLDEQVPPPAAEKPAEPGRRKQKITRLGAVMGTPAYMPPEQAEGKVNEIDTRSDIYALGVILYAIVSGDLPFRASSTPELLIKIVDEEAVRPRERNPRCPWELERIVLKAIAKRKDDRYQTARDLMADVEAWLEGRPVVAAGGGPLYRARKFAGRNRAAVAVAALAVAIGAGAAVKVWRDGVARVELLVQEGREASGRAAAIVRKYEAGVATLDPARATDMLDEAKNDYKAAVGKASAAIDRDPANLAAHDLSRHASAGVTEVETLMKQVEAARIAAVERAVLEAIGRESPGDRPAVLDALKRVRDSLVKVGVALELHPKSAAALELLSTGAELQSSLRQRESEFEKHETFRRHMGEAEGHLTAARGGEAKDRRAELYKAASEALSQAFGIYPGDKSVRGRRVDVALARARLELDAREFPVAKVLAADVRPLDPVQVDAFLADLQKSSGVERDFLAAFEKGEILRERGDFKLAAGEYVAALRLAPERPEAEFGLRFVRGREAAEADRHEEAHKIYLEARTFAKRGVDAAALDLADGRSLEKLADEAVHDADKKLKAGLYDEAMAEVARALDFYPEHRRALEVRAEVSAMRAAPPGTVLLAEGAFFYGAGGETLTPVSCSAFFLDRTEVSNGDFATFVRKGGYEKPEYSEYWDAEGLAARASFVGRDGRPGPLGWKNGQPPTGDDKLPVTGISWYEARAFARWRQPGGWRLPSEKEWEKAAIWDPKAGRRVARPWFAPQPDGSVRSDWESTWSAFFRRLKPFAVDETLSNDKGRVIDDVSPSGARHLWGNVREIVEADGGGPGIRGGSYRSLLEERSTAYRTFPGSATYRAPDVGFRLARSVAR